MFYKVSVSFYKDLIKIKDGEIEIGVMAKPLKGKANSEIIRKIAKHFGISRSNVRIVAGVKSMNEVVEISTQNPKK